MPKQELWHEIKAEIVAYIAYFWIFILYIFGIMNFTSFRRKNIIIYDIENRKAWFFHSL